MTYTFQFGIVFDCFAQLVEGALLTIRLAAMAMVFGLIVAVIWLGPTIGLLVTSFRPRTDIQSAGWWEVFGTMRFTLENYQQVNNAFDIGGAAATGVVTVILTIIVATFALRMFARVFQFEEAR